MTFAGTDPSQMLRVAPRSNWAGPRNRKGNIKVIGHLPPARPAATLPVGFGNQDGAARRARRSKDWTGFPQPTNT